MKFQFIIFPIVVASVVAASTSCRVSAEQPEIALKPMMTVPGEVVLEEDFTKAGTKLDKEVWQSRQGTRWAVEDGVLRGRESSAEYQSAREHHFGYEPRLSIPVTPPEFVAKFSFRFIDGTETSIVPFVEFGHHVCRVRFSEEGTTLIADHETLKLDEASGFKWKQGQWYHALAEMHDGQFVMQIQDGPTLHGSHESFRKSPTSGGNGIGFAGPKKGIVEIDNVSIATVTGVLPSWKKSLAGLGKSDPVVIKQRKPSRAKKQ